MEDVCINHGGYKVEEHLFPKKMENNNNVTFEFGHYKTKIAKKYLSKHKWIEIVIESGGSL